LLSFDSGGRSIGGRYSAQAAIDRYPLPAPGRPLELQQTSCTSLLLWIDGTTQTDTVYAVTPMLTAAWPASMSRQVVMTHGTGSGSYDTTRHAILTCNQKLA